MSVFPGYKFTSEGFAAIKTVRAKHSQTETRQKKNTWKRLCCDKGEYQHEMSALQTRYLLTCCTIKFLMFVCLIKISPRNNFNILSGDSRWSLPGSMLSSNLDIIRFSIWNVAADDEVWSVVTSLRHMFVWLGPLTVRLRLRGTECDTSAAALSLSLSPLRLGRQHRVGTGFRLFLSPHFSNISTNPSLSLHCWYMGVAVEVWHCAAIVWIKVKDLEGKI